LSQQYEVRKIHKEGSERMSRGMTIPHKFLKELALEQGNYIKIYLDEKGSKKIWIEKLE
jgi:antitoxin component of MazEF toxin-antitoxin module